MATIVTRSGKGSELTHAELDANFTNLNDELAGKQASLTVATQAEMEAGTESALRAMSPLRVKQAIDVLAGSKLTRSARTANTILGTADKGALIDITSGTFTQTFAACSTLGNGWFCYIRNGGTGDITLDPNASETIDGLTSYIMYPGEVRLVQCDGAALRTVVLNSFYKVFTASGAFTKPPGYAAFEGLAISGGQSGQKSGSATIAAEGGRGGGCFPFAISADRFSASTTITVGAGGAASTSSTQNAGGNTAVGSLLTVYGAGVVAANIPGSVLRAVTPSAGAFTGALAAATADGLSSVYGGGNVSFQSPEQGSSVYGGAAGGCVSNSGSTVSAAGTSTSGGNGGSASSGSSGSAGVAPGGGGGATQTGTQSGAGARGELRIWGVL